MKLLLKTSLLIITVSVFIFLVGNTLFFHFTKQMISKHINTELISQMHKTMKMVQEPEFRKGNILFSEEIEIDTVAMNYIRKPHFSDTVLYSNIQKKFIPHRSLRFTYPKNGVNLLITIHKSLLSSDKLIERITLATIIMVLTFIVIIFVLNRFIFSTIWRNFFTNLKQVEQFDVKGTQELKLESSEIEEFDKLNKVLERMLDRIQTDFVNLKELTANTSHEIQTPLAIIKSKAELLLQSEHLSESDMETLGAILTTTERLSKLNQSLLLITKIENNQFQDAQLLNLKEVVEKFLQNYDMLFQAGDFQIQTELQQMKLFIHPILLDVLLSNLIKNAAVHGEPGGDIFVGIEQGVLTVSNSGASLKMEQEDLFKRFSKGSSHKNSSGLGLEIVKRICDYYQLIVDYSYQDEKHSFTIDFSPIIKR